MSHLNRITGIYIDIGLGAGLGIGLGVGAGIKVGVFVKAVYRYQVKAAALK